MTDHASREQVKQRIYAALRADRGGIDYDNPARPYTFAESWLYDEQEDAE